MSTGYVQSSAPSLRETPFQIQIRENDPKFAQTVALLREGIVLDRVEEQYDRIVAAPPPITDSYSKIAVIIGVHLGMAAAANMANLSEQIHTGVTAARQSFTAFLRSNRIDIASLREQFRTGTTSIEQAVKQFVESQLEPFQKAPDRELVTYPKSQELQAPKANPIRPVRTGLPQVPHLNL